MSRKAAKMIFLIPASVILLIAGMLIVNKITAIADDDTIFTVSSEPVSKAEYQFVMSGLKPEVYSYFSQKYKATESPGFWEQSFGGEIPCRILRTKTLDALRKIKTEQLLFRENRIADDISFRGFLELFKAENEKRKLAASLNQPVYGPLQFTERVYYEYLHSEWKQKLKQALSGKILNVSEEEINARIDDLKYDSGDVAVPSDRREIKTFIVNDLIERKYEEMIYRLSENARIIPGISNSRLYRIDMELL